MLIYERDIYIIKRVNLCLYTSYSYCFIVFMEYTSNCVIDLENTVHIKIFVYCVDWEDTVLINIFVYCVGHYNTCMG